MTRPFHPLRPDPSRTPDPVFDTIVAHRSVRAFAPDPVPDELVADLKEAMRRAPTSSALQTYTAVFVRDVERKRALQPHAGGQDYVGGCGLFVVGCIDLRRVRQLTDRRGYPYRASDLRGLIAALEDLSISLQNASLVAQARGWGTVMIGGVLNGASEIAALLDLPPRVAPVLGLCVGRPREAPGAVPLRPRLPSRVTFHDETYRLDDDEEAAAYDAFDHEVRERGYYDGRRIPGAAIGLEPDPVPEDAYGWTEHVARKQSRLWWRDATPKLHHDLAALGLDLELDRSGTETATAPIERNEP